MKSKALSYLLPLYLVIFVGFIGYSLIITIFTPLFIQGSNALVPQNSSLGARTILLGFILFLYPAGQFFSSSILGTFSERFGKKNILIISLIVTAACYALIAIALNINSLTLLIFSLIIAGLSEGNVVLAQSAISDIVTLKERSSFLGYIYLSASTAYIIGPLLGGKLADKNLISWFSNSTPFWLVFILLIVSWIWILISFVEANVPKQRKIKYFNVFRNVKNVFLDRNRRFVYLVNFFLYLGIFGFFRAYPMYLTDALKLGPSRLSEFIAWVAVPIVLSNLWLTTAISKIYSPLKITVIAGILTGIFMILVAFSSTISALWITLFLTSLSLSICLPSSAAQLAKRTSFDEKGLEQSNNQSLQIGAEAFSGLIAGLLAAVYIPFSLIVLGSILILFSFALLINYSLSKA